jgi:hypothetical protein
LTLFEYLAVAFSIVVAFSVTRLLEGLVHLIHSENRYWVHTVWSLQTLGNSFAVWWVLFSFSDSDWNYRLFLWVLLGPMILFAMAVTLIPRGFENVADWKAHYFDNSRTFFALQVANVLHVFSLVLVFSFVGYAGVFPISVALVALYAAAAVTKNERFHIGVTVAGLIVGFGAILPTI